MTFLAIHDFVRRRLYYPGGGGSMFSHARSAAKCEEERAEMRALDAKLDAFAAMLKERRPVAGRG